MAKKRRIAIYPGSFDPITNGHIDIIKRAALLFDELIVTISSNSSKDSFFSISKRKKILYDCLKNHQNVKIDTFDTLLVNYAESKNILTIVRGLRALSDFEYEFRMAIMNRNLNVNIETVFLMTDEKFAHISSSLIKEIHFLGGDVQDFVPESVIKALNGISDEKFAK
ncbi:MAG: pantetheine-phosphate adenylyltransferase [Candidatus Marinimicrobia bacterium]|nr:pantetheine-phosphate adenylyltransferase [Candidatus Neomarinimicrobiota bacterium]